MIAATVELAEAPSLELEPQQIERLSRSGGVCGHERIRSPGRAKQFVARFVFKDRLKAFPILKMYPSTVFEFYEPRIHPVVVLAFVLFCLHLPHLPFPACLPGMRH